MIIMESAIAMNNDYIECSTALGKIDLFAEASYKEYEINLKEIAVKVLKENGTSEDFDFLATEAANGYIERAKKAIEKIVEAIKKFIRNCKEKLISLVANAKTNAAVNKVEDVCKSNPKFRSQKIEYQNTDKQVGVIQHGIDSIRKKVAKVKAKGVATQNDIDDIERIESDTMKKVAAISVITVVTVGTAVTLFKKCNSATEVEAVLNENSVSDCDILVNEDTAKTPDTAAFFTKASGLMAKLKKEKTSKVVVKSTSLLDAIKKAVSKAKGDIISENLEAQIGESTIEKLAMFSYVVESSEKDEDGDNDNDETPDVDDYFDDLCDDLFSDKDDEDDAKDNDVDDVKKESVDDTDTVTAEMYMEQLETELFGDNETVTTESSDDSDTDTTSELSDVYLEQLESELFGDNETVTTESTDTNKSDLYTMADELISEMEDFFNN